MDKLSEKFEIPSLRLLGWRIVEYVSEWSFMCHAGLVLLVAWIASYLHLNVALVCTLGFLYLYQIENRQRGRLKWKIRHEERKNASKQRLNEGETVRWMNEALERIWPIFLENFSSKMLLVPLTSFFDRFKPWSAKKMVLQNLSLGKTPPIVTMVRILDDPVEGDDLAIEASLEWMAANDMAAVVAVKVRRRLGLGIWATFHICKLRLEGKVKVGLKFKDGWPVIERVRISFGTAPYLEMAAYPLYNSGVDVTELPGLASWMDRLVADALAQSLVEPNMIEIDMEKLMKDVMRPQGPAQQPRGDWFSMRGNPPAADVVVEILEATDLRVGDLNGYSDPFVKVMLGLQQAETSVKWKTLNPKWNETLRFSIPGWEQTSEQPYTMLIKVRDKDHIFDDQLGHNVVDITQFRDGKRHDFWLKLKDVETGKIHLAITVLDKQTDSHSSEDTPSTTLEMADHVLSQQSDRSTASEGLTLPVSPIYAQSQPLAASPKDRVSARQKLKTLKSGKSLSKDPAQVDTSGKNVGRQSSGIFSSKSSRKHGTTQLGSDREKSSIRSGEYSPVTPHGLTSARSAMPKEADVAGDSTDDTTKVLDVGFGELGAVKVCQLGDVEPTTGPNNKRVVESKRPEDISNSEEGYSKPLNQVPLGGETLTNIEEDGGPSRKLRSAKLKLNCKYHDYRARKGAEKDAEHQELQSRRKFSSNANGTRVHLTLDPSVGQPENISMTGLPLGQDPTHTTSVSEGQEGEVVDAGTLPGDHDESDKHHVRNKAKGFFGKAAGHLGHQLSQKLIRRKHPDKEGPSSSEEFTSSSELGGSGRLEPAVKEPRPKTEVPMSGPGVAKQPLPSSSKQSETSHSSLIPSEPPNRPPPGLPQPVAPINVQAGSEKIHSSEPLRPVPTHSEDAQQSSTQGSELFQTEGLPKPAPPPDVREPDGTRNSPL